MVKLELGSTGLSSGNKEIERRFTCVLPKERYRDFKFISQSYLSTSPDEEVRIRKETFGNKDEYFIVVKKGAGLVREELATRISETTFTTLSRRNDERFISKTRYHYVDGPHTISVDVYTHDPTLVLAEVEFASEEEARAYIPPDWLGFDVTKDEHFNDKVIWLKMFGWF